MAGSMRYRLRVGAPDSAEMVAFAKAMARIQTITDNRGFAFVAGLHGAPFWYCWHHQASAQSDLRAQLFLPWHRAYLHYLDLALNDFAEGGVAQPWWDWGNTQDIPDSYAVAEIDAEDNPLRRFRMDLQLSSGNVNRFTRRAPGQSPFGRLPTAAEVDAILGDADWSSFSDKLQDFHDGVHVWVGGDMGGTTLAGYDPVFYAHHSMVDRLWYLWQVRHGINNIPVGLLDLVLDPFAVRVRDVLDTRELGYEYADTSIPIEPVQPVVVG